MHFNEHFKLRDKHALLSPSKCHWVEYDMEKVRSLYLASVAVERGVKLHDLARRCIEERVNLPKVKKTLNLYVNDAIGYRMTPEQVLYFSDNCFGTADAICYRDGMLRIHDLKTGRTRADFRQLEVYAALFFLEYKDAKLEQSDIELRIYQSNEAAIYIPEKELIFSRMKQIIDADKEIEYMKTEV